MKNNKDLKAKYVALAAAVTVAATALTGCNKTIIDVKYQFNKAFIFDNENHSVCIVDVSAWKDYDGEQLQLVLADGTYILTSTFDTKLLYVNDHTMSAEEIAKAMKGEDVKITYLNPEPTYGYYDEYGAEFDSEYAPDADYQPKLG